MDQTVFILDNDFFEDDVNCVEAIAEEINKLANSEKLNIVYDPICSDLFRKAAPPSNLLQDVMINYYGQLEEIDEHALKWFHLGPHQIFAIDMIGELLFQLEYAKRQVYAFGSLPLKHRNSVVHLYYYISPYADISDKFYLIDEKKYYEILNNNIEDMKAKLKVHKKNEKSSRNKRG
jgi:hypothetical protein